MEKREQKLEKFGAGRWMRNLSWYNFKLTLLRVALITFAYTEQIFKIISLSVNGKKLNFNPENQYSGYNLVEAQTSC